ncbi:helix-turn-helix domain-containing protein [Morganella morganii]|uniref:helix-turn-helix domain-containing protein n=1 Tax=Morganella morganii TaxID=582 RepID=UPI001F2DE13E|nr:helix-turn-helix transcriptional regulator [Morganella morganii]MCF1267053.1 helix-turn-helix domain-containing protein [Morganella morganii]
MTNLSTLGEKIRMIREAENLNRKEMAELIGASYGTLNNYETKGVLVTETVLVKLTTHPRFEKYTLWLMTGKTNEAMGQISPTLSPDGADTIPSDHSERKIG